MSPVQVGAALADSLALETAAVDGAVVHDRVEGVQRGLLDKMPAAVAVAEGQPLLAGVPFARPAGISAAVAPGGVHMVQ